MFQRRHIFAPVFLAVLAACGEATADTLLPLATEEAQTLPSGVAEVTLGASYTKGLRFPPFTSSEDAGADSSLLAVPQLGFRIAAGSWAEIQATYELLRFEDTQDGNSSTTFGSGDARLFTKVSILAESQSRPALGLRFGTKLPNANYADHLGTDEIDFLSDALVSRDFGPATVHANLGLHLLGNPGPTGGQDDLFSYSVAVVSQPLGAAATPAVWVRLVTELAGLAGSRFDNDRTAVRLGMQFHSPLVGFYAGASTGLQHPSEDWAVTGGAILTFRPEDLLPAANEEGWIE